MGKEEATYSHGHHSSVVNMHARRTVQDCAAFLLPHIKPTDSILDVGCGPGSISCDFAQLVPQGRVEGIDAVDSVLDQARESAVSRNLSNITFSSADANALPYADGTFDIVYCHQVLQHVKNPLAVLSEMRRVAKRLVAARESDYKSFAWYPEPSGLDDWGSLYQAVARANGGEPNAGRKLHVWAREAGFTPSQVTMAWNSWCYTGPKAQSWGDSWADRALYSGFATTAKSHNLATDEDLQRISGAWKTWGQSSDAFLAVPSAEMLCTVS